MIGNTFPHRRGGAFLCVDEVARELKHVHCPDIRYDLLGERRCLPPEPAVPLANLVIVAFNDRGRDCLVCWIPPDDSPDHGNQAIPLPLFEHLTVIDAGFTVQLRQCLAILRISIGCNDNRIRWLGQREPFKYPIEEMSARFLRSFSAAIRDDEARAVLDSKICPPFAELSVFQSVTMFVFFGQKSRVRRVRLVRGRGSTERSHSRLRHARRSAGNTG